MINVFFIEWDRKWGYYIVSVHINIRAMGNHKRVDMFGFPSTRHNHLYLLLIIVYQLNELILEYKKGTLLKAKLTST